MRTFSRSAALRATDHAFSHSNTFHDNSFTNNLFQLISTGLKELRRLVSLVSTVSVTVPLWEDKSRSWKSNNTLSTIVPSVVREPWREVLLVSGHVLHVREPLLVVRTLHPLLQLPQSDLLSEDWEKWLKLKLMSYIHLLCTIYV